MNVLFLKGINDSMLIRGCLLTLTYGHNTVPHTGRNAFQLVRSVQDETVIAKKFSEVSLVTAFILNPTLIQAKCGASSFT